MQPTIENVNFKQDKKVGDVEDKYGIFEKKKPKQKKQNKKKESKYVSSDMVDIIIFAEFFF